MVKERYFNLLPKISEILDSNNRNIEKICNCLDMNNDDDKFILYVLSMGKFIDNEFEYPNPSVLEDSFCVPEFICSKNKENLYEKKEKFYIKDKIKVKTFVFSPENFDISNIPEDIKNNEFLEKMDNYKTFIKETDIKPNSIEVLFNDGRVDYFKIKYYERYKDFDVIERCKFI